MQNAYRNLKNSIGLTDSDTDFTIQDIDVPLDIVPEFDTGFELVQKFNPSVKAKQYQILGAKLNTKITKGSRLPRISASPQAYQVLQKIYPMLSQTHTMIKAGQMQTSLSRFQSIQVIAYQLEFKKLK